MLQRVRTHVHLVTDDAQALYHWLRADASVKVHGSVTARPSRDPTRMSALDLVDVVLTHAEGMSALALAVLAWRQSRVNQGTVRLTRSDGLTLTIAPGSTVSAETISNFLADDAGTQG